jgi:cell volume regulation protein A
MAGGARRCSSSITTVAAVHEIESFGLLVLGVAGAFYLAVLSTKATRAVPVPAPAFFLLGAAVVAEIFPSLRDHVPIRAVERIGVVALVVILFDGGMHVGRRRFRSSAVPIAVLGIVGTFATAAVLAAAARYLLGFGWMTSSLVGAALAPTDPAVMFSVLGNREVGGRTGTILEGESGANDPVGIALMIGLLAYATSIHATPWIAVREFVVEMAVGLAIGLGGGVALAQFMRRIPLPREGLYPLRTLAASGVIYGAAAVAHGSGFLAVFVAGLWIGDENAPYKPEIERFHSSLASLAEIVVFVALGVTVSLSSLGHDHVWFDGIVLALVLAFVARPLVGGALLLPARLRAGEKLFVLWGGLKGAVPILLAALAVLDGAAQSSRIYGIVFVVVAFSVVVQGATVPLVAGRLGVPMREVEPEPWDISIRLREQPRGVQRFVVRRGARAVGRAISELPLGERAWISMIVRAEQPLEARGHTVLEAGDEVVVLAEQDTRPALRALFEET